MTMRWTPSTPQPTSASGDELIEDLSLMLSFLLVMELPDWDREPGDRTDRIEETMEEAGHLWRAFVAERQSRAGAVDRLGTRLAATIADRESFYSDRLPTPRLVSGDMTAGD